MFYPILHQLQSAYFQENIPQKDEELSILNYKIKILDVSSSKIEEISLKVLDAEEN